MQAPKQSGVKTNTLIAPKFLKFFSDSTCKTWLCDEDGWAETSGVHINTNIFACYTSENNRWSACLNHTFFLKAVIWSGNSNDEP